MSRKREEYRSLKAEHRVDISKVRAVEGNAVLHAGIYANNKLPLTPLEPQSCFGDRPLKFQAFCPQNGTAVLKGLNTYAFLQGIDSSFSDLLASFVFCFISELFFMFFWFLFSGLACVCEGVTY